jgi:hypothetical protein
MFSRSDIARLITCHLHLVHVESDLTDREFQTLLNAFDALERLRNQNASEAQDFDEGEARSLTVQLHCARAEAAGRAVTIDEAAAILEGLESAGLKFIIRSGEMPGVVPVAVQRLPWVAPARLDTRGPR